MEGLISATFVSFAAETLAGLSETEFPATITRTMLEQSC